MEANRTSKIRRRLNPTTSSRSLYGLITAKTPSNYPSPTQKPAQTISGVALVITSGRTAPDTSPESLKLKPRSITISNQHVYRPQKKRGVKRLFSPAPTTAHLTTPRTKHTHVARPSPPARGRYKENDIFAAPFVWISPAHSGGDNNSDVEIHDKSA